jgi:hypothetical protein
MNNGFKSGWCLPPPVVEITLCLFIKTGTMPVLVLAGLVILPGPTVSISEELKTGYGRLRLSILPE